MRNCYLVVPNQTISVRNVSLLERGFEGVNVTVIAQLSPGPSGLEQVLVG
jgi:hypothetical protein